MRHLTRDEVPALHRMILAQSGVGPGLRDPGALDSALAQPRMTFDGADLDPSLAERAAALGFSLIGNHPFVDGDKRIGHAAMETLLILNRLEVDAAVDKQERVILDSASGRLAREPLTDWLHARLVPRRAN